MIKAYPLTIYVLQITGFTLTLFLLFTIFFSKLRRHPVIHSLLIFTALRAVIIFLPFFVWDDLDRELSDRLPPQLMIPSKALEEFCIAQAMLIDFILIINCAFIVSFTVPMLDMAIESTKEHPTTETLDPFLHVRHRWYQFRPFPLCIAPILWGLPILVLSACLQATRLPNWYTDVDGDDEETPGAVFTSVYCTGQPFGRALQVLFGIGVFVPLFIALVLSAAIVFFLIRYYRTNGNFGRGSLDRILMARWGILVTAILMSTSLALILVSRHNNDESSLLYKAEIMWEGIMPNFIFFIFATQQDILQIWARWLRSLLRLPPPSNPPQSPPLNPATTRPFPYMSSSFPPDIDPPRKFRVRFWKSDDDEMGVVVEGGIRTMPDGSLPSSVVRKLSEASGSGSSSGGGGGTKVVPIAMMPPSPTRNTNAAEYPFRTTIWPPSPTGPTHNVSRTKSKRKSHSRGGGGEAVDLGPAIVAAKDIYTLARTNTPNFYPSSPSANSSTSKLDIISLDARSHSLTAAASSFSQHHNHDIDSDSGWGEDSRSIAGTMASATTKASESSNQRWWRQQLPHVSENIQSPAFGMSFLLPMTPGSSAAPTRRGSRAGLESIPQQPSPPPPVPLPPPPIEEVPLEEMGSERDSRIWEMLGGEEGEMEHPLSQSHDRS